MSTPAYTPPEFHLHSEKDPFERSHLKHAILLSLLLHAFVLAALIFKDAILPFETKEYLPSLRVDLVALPGHKVNETPVLTPVIEEKKEKNKPTKRISPLQRRKRKKKRVMRKSKMQWPELKP